MSVPADWLVPDWPAPARVKALCTTRSGGQSRPPYNSLNLGTHVGDDGADVLANRAVLRRALGVRPVFLEQVHGTHVQPLAPDTPDGAVADACLTTQPGVACTIMVADCLPILLCDATGTWVAAAHAGWRGLAGQGGVGVVESTLAEVYASNNALAPVKYAQAAPEIIAWLGPCIGPTAFEVGDEVRQAFVEGAPGAVDCFVPAGPGKWLTNLPALARQRLRAAGVNAVYGNDGSTPWCTVSNPSRFFSHRRDRVSGRLAACIWLG
ncbi:peptidoglycan editing factor PgeF [Rhodoferax saidenbachensis]|uniref:Purine nucleoside phosphorylase n=1 Tax=Rhodoferax saidenbachensis TaxID=1484693 RepID=A0ABU1ZII6_9BURK|nr:peptidoglycan editing factor PgeF [Rhodoferax saidenbachensis]MDR7305360.1 YfiH family protein [Rhodoferax saidenbachensis]